MAVTSIYESIELTPATTSSNYNQLLPSTPGQSIKNKDIVESMEKCRQKLLRDNQPLAKPLNDTSGMLNCDILPKCISHADIPWCSYTWDTITCWPATPGNSSSFQPCPSLPGLDRTS
jgi:hypothetical protein